MFGSLFQHPRICLQFRKIPTFCVGRNIINTIPYLPRHFISIFLHLESVATPRTNEKSEENHSDCIQNYSNVSLCFVLRCNDLTRPVSLCRYIQTMGLVSVYLCTLIKRSYNETSDRLQVGAGYPQCSE